MSDTATITVPRYLAPDGKPTCCADLTTGQMCRFLGVKNFGLHDVCMLGEQRDLHRVDGFTRPHQQCEVWERT